MNTMTDRRKFLISTGTFCLSGSLLSSVGCLEGAKKKPSRKPNVILYLTDDLGWNDVGCYGNDRISTPHIDRLAADGIIFTDAHTPSSICTPTRYGLLTGRYCWRTWVKKGVIANTPLLVEPGRLTLGQLFKEEGYTTACIGKWHLGTRMNPPDSFDGETHFIPPVYPGPNEVGFDYSFVLPVGHFYPPYIYLENHNIFNYNPDDPIKLVKSPDAGHRGYIQHGGTEARYEDEDVTTDLTNKAVEYIKQQKDHPFFLYFATSSPHDPYTPAERFRGKSKLGIYGDFVQEIDWSIGHLIKTLKKYGVYENTIIIFTSDNGGVNKRSVFKDYDHNPNGMWRGQKGQIYEGSNRVPFIIRWPNNAFGGRTSDHVIMLNDMLASCASYFGRELPPGEGVDSQNMLSALQGYADAPPRLNAIFHSRGGMFAIRQGEWKYIHGTGDGDYRKEEYPSPKEKTEGQLYNLKTDPAETTNLIAQHPEIAEQLQNQLADCYSK